MKSSMIILMIAKDVNVINIFKSGSYSQSSNEKLEDYLFQINKIYNQVVSYFLVDKNGEFSYDNAPHKCGDVEGYNGFLRCLENFKNKGVVDVHTLNHDLFFERFNRTDYINGDLSDGFEELGSPYYGKLSTNDNTSYMVRLEKFTGKYDTNIKLYKLHGSLNYLPFFSTGSNGFMKPDCYIKTKSGIGCGELYKEINQSDGSMKYDHCFINYHPDFLTGTTSKIIRYKESLIFEPLFDLFKENLKKADKLIIIGYGCKDSEINNMIIQNFDKNKKCYVVDPYAGDQVKDFISKLGENVSLIKKPINDLSIEDFE